MRVCGCVCLFGYLCLCDTIGGVGGWVVNQYQPPNVRIEMKVNEFEIIQSRAEQTPIYAHIYNNSSQKFQINQIRRCANFGRGQKSDSNFDDPQWLFVAYSPVGVLLRFDDDKL